MKDFGDEQPVVLVVDGQREVLDTVATVLSQTNLSCRCCTTSEEAISAAQATPPALILCDANLQGESGWTTCQRIKQQSGLQDVPVMFLSGAQLPDVVRRHHAAGGVYCLRKPLDSKVLVELVDQALGIPASLAGQ